MTWKGPKVSGVTGVPVATPLSKRSFGECVKLAVPLAARR